MIRAAIVGCLAALVALAQPAAAAPGDRFLACDRYTGDVAAAVRR